MKLTGMNIFWLLGIVELCSNLAVGHIILVKPANDISSISVSPTVAAQLVNRVVSAVATPTPTQAVIVDNCNKFYYVQPGETCNAIAAKYDIPVSSFLAWNPSAGADCTTLWANAWACVGVIVPTSTVSIPITVSPTHTVFPTSTIPGNGIPTPTPTQEGMVGTCKRFHFVLPGQTCVDVAAQYGITVSSVINWNPAAGSQCTNLWANTYMCVGVL